MKKMLLLGAIAVLAVACGNKAKTENENAKTGQNAEYMQYLDSLKADNNLKITMGKVPVTIVGKELKVGDKIESGENADIVIGNALKLKDIPVGTNVHNVELKPGKGGQLVRSAGSEAQLMGKEGRFAQLRLPSGEFRLVHLECRATVGQVGNLSHELITIGKAGRSRHMGKRPHVRGSAMNPVDHPHGGGEGRTPVGRPAPSTPWGKPALGLKTRKKNKKSNKFIVRRRTKN